MGEMKAQIRLETQTEGKRTVVKAPAVWSPTDGGGDIVYSDGDDRVTLAWRGGTLSLLREGERGQSAEFVPEVLTKFTMRLGALTGDVPLYTHFLRTDRSADALDILLSYELRFQGGLQKFLLKISVRNFSEEA